MAQFSGISSDSHYKECMEETKSCTEVMLCLPQIITYTVAEKGEHW